MKLRKLLPIVFLSIAGLAACGPKDTYDINVTNSSDITAEWHVGDADRVLQLEATKNGEAVNATQLLNTEIFVTSSNTDVLATVGLVLKAVSAGEVDFTVRYNTVEIKYELEILPERTCIDKYQTVHAGTEADPLDYADALNIGRQMKAAAKSTDEDDIYIKGVVKYWYHFPGERKGNDEATSWFIEGAGTETKAEELFEMYKITKENGQSLTDEDIWPGAEVVIKGQIGYYNNQLETTKGQFVKVSGGAARVAPELKQVGVNTKNTGALAVGKALQDGDTTWDRYEITGYTVNFLGTNKDGTFNYMIADSKTETASTKQFEIYASKTELKYQEKVKVTCRIKNYHGTIETNVLEKVDVLEAGTDWVEYKEPTVIKDKALADLFADESGNYKQAYEVTGIVSKWDSKNNVPNEDGTKYGNFYLKTQGDDEHEYYIYGASGTASALSWGKYSNKYSFVNPQDFLTNTLTKDIKIGSMVTMKLVRCDYSKTVDGVTTVTPEATGIVLEVGTPLAKVESDVFATSFTADAENSKLATYTNETLSFTLDQNESTTANRLSDADHLRIYKNAKFTVAFSGGKIAKIQFVCTAASYAAEANWTLEEGYTADFNDKVVTVTCPENATSVTFVAANQVRINKVIVSYIAADAA